MSMLTDIWKNFPDIVEGWSNLVVRKPEVEEKALERLLICKDCDANTTSPRVMMHSKCRDCGCILEAKSRSGSKCPRNKWPQ